MKRLFLALLLVGVLACGGGGNSDPVEPGNNQPSAMVVPSGTFALTATMSVDGCARNDVWDGDYNLEISGKTFTMGGFAGTWDGKTGFARGETDKVVTTTRACTLSNYSTAYLTFKNKDSFHGTITWRHTLKGSCPNLQGCSTTWIVNGTRTTP